jgi:hypothetical protein
MRSITELNHILKRRSAIEVKLNTLAHHALRSASGKAFSAGQRNLVTTSHCGSSWSKPTAAVARSINVVPKMSFPPGQPPTGLSNAFTAAASPSVASSAGSGESTASALLSPNHPRNLRKLATIDLTDEYTIKSYVGAANALRDKAHSADLQGQLEQAFVNYLKAAQ